MKKKPNVPNAAIVAIIKKKVVWDHLPKAKDAMRLPSIYEVI